jgi:hypothetical protein
MRTVNVTELGGPPDPENEDPLAGQDQRASDDLSKIEATNTPAGSETQAPACEFCGRSFERRRGGGSKQRFCGTKCRQDSHAGKVPGTDTGTHSASSAPVSAPNPYPQPSGHWSDTKGHQFCWTDDDTVIREQSETAVYINPYNEVIIRQRPYPDDDVFVLIKREYLPLLIRRLQRIMEHGE